MNKFYTKNALQESLRAAGSLLYESTFTETLDELDKLYEEEATTASTEEKAEEIVNQLQDSEYEDFVNILNSDGKSKEFLHFLKKHYKFGDDAIGTIKVARPQKGTISCAKLIPTQENISLSKSLGMINKGGWSEQIINDPKNAFTTPTVVYAGQYIIDGHHRWSKAYALNGKDCKISVLNFPAIEGVNWEDMLKAIQLAIISANPAAKLVNDVKNDNMLADDGSASRQFYIDNACDEVVQAMKNQNRGETKEEQGDFVANNVKAMQKTSYPVSGAKPRAVMPQMDDAGKALDRIKANGIIDITND